VIRIEDLMTALKKNNMTITYQTIENLFNLPFLELQYKAQAIHVKNFSLNQMQLSVLCSVKTGSCPEDCAYCPQSGHYSTDVERHKLLAISEVKRRAESAKKNGASRFCMGAAWKYPPEKDFETILQMVELVHQIGLETCVTLGSISSQQAIALKQAGLDYYNHNLDTSPEYYKNIITTRTYQDRLVTLDHVQTAGLKVCCGGIVGMGESRQDRINLLLQLANLRKHPESVPINRLIAVQGTPLQDCPEIDNLEFIRVIAVARIIMPHSVVRVSAGRDSMSEEMQILCFICGANSIFLGDELLTAKNVSMHQDKQMFTKLGLQCQ